MSSLTYYHLLPWYIKISIEGVAVIMEYSLIRKASILLLDLFTRSLSSFLLDIRFYNIGMKSIFLSILLSFLFCFFFFEFNLLL